MRKHSVAILLFLASAAFVSCDEGPSEDDESLPYYSWPTSGTWSGYKSEPLKETVQATIGDESGNLVLNGALIKANKLLAHLGTIASEARLAAGDRDWTSKLEFKEITATASGPDVLPPESRGSSYNSRGPWFVLLESGESYIYGTSVSTSENHSENDPVNFELRMTDTARNVCVVAKSSQVPRADKSLQGAENMYIGSLSVEVLAAGCLEPLANQGGLANISRVIAPGDSKTTVESIMGTKGLEITSPSLWTWKGLYRSPACAPALSTCSITFGSDGMVSGQSGIKASYLNLTRW